MARSNPIRPCSPGAPRGAAPGRSVGLLLAGLFLVGGLGSAQATKYAAEFLRIGAGARALGMGAAVTSHVDDASAIYWNPAGMVHVPHAEIMLMHAEQFAELADYDFAGYVLSLNETGALGIGLVRFAVSDIRITKDAYIDENGNHQYDWGEPIRPELFCYDSDTEYAFLFSFARAVRPEFSYGISLKLIRQDLPGHSSFGVGVDLGVMWRPRPALRLGARLSDATATQLYWDTGTRETVTPSLFLGGSYTQLFPGMRTEVSLAVDLALTFDGRETASSLAFGTPSLAADLPAENFFWGDLRTGIEAWYRGLFAARAGYQESGATAGAGFLLRGFGIDYAFVPHEALGNSHRLSASYSF
ncbi:MAG: PorV/PorQ family protein [Candidatus Eisenbacteria sp.]|nr:PorV/PorQ family protein [Candidatus Eisenbacteria bacterium]